jgi:hypothetical protein
MHQAALLEQRMAIKRNSEMERQKVIQSMEKMKKVPGPKVWCAAFLLMLCCFQYGGTDTYDIVECLALCMCFMLPVI